MHFLRFYPALLLSKECTRSLYCYLFCLQVCLPLERAFHLPLVYSFCYAVHAPPERYPFLFEAIIMLHCFTQFIPLAIYLLKCEAIMDLCQSHLVQLTTKISSYDRLHAKVRLLALCIPLHPLIIHFFF